MTSDFESITSSNYAFREEGGRRYQAPELRVTNWWMGFLVLTDCRFHSVEDAPYPLPNDEDELERLKDLQHCIKLFFGRNILPTIASNPSLIGISQIPIPCFGILSAKYTLICWLLPFGWSSDGVHNNAISYLYLWVCSDESWYWHGIRSLGNPSRGGISKNHRHGYFSCATDRSSPQLRIPTGEFTRRIEFRYWERRLPAF